MNYIKPYLEYFRTFSLSDIITLFGIFIGIIVFIIGIVFVVWWDLKKKQWARFDKFQPSFLFFKYILETGIFPEDRATYINFISKLFADQDNSMILIRDRLKGKRRGIFDQKWTEYKEKRKGYNEPYWNAKTFNIVGHANKDKEILNLLNELLKIAKNN